MALARVLSTRVDPAIADLLIRRAQAHGLTVAAELREAVSAHVAGVRYYPDRELSPGKRDAYHAKAQDLSVLRGLSKQEVCGEALAAASVHFGAEFQSVTELTDRQGSWTLDWLEARLREARTPIPAESAPQSESSGA